tara:strand:- start:988 stop:2049 length:1062 start_codon:yes stop_codon:yes gene_type:complete
MSDDNDTNKVGTTITYDSQHALDAARKYKEQIARQLGHKLANRPSTANEMRRDKIGTELLDNVLGKRSLPQNYASSRPFVAPSQGGIKTDPYLKKSGADYAGWHRTSPVNMSAALDDDAWVRGAYKSLLGRDADAAGLANWKANLASGSSREDVVANMRRAPEYRDKFIGEAFKNLLGRDVGLEGIDYWSKQMEGGQSEDSIIANIKRSDEYGRKQQNEMRASISPKSPTQLMNETYDDKIATLGRSLQDANDQVQKDYGTAQDYTPLLTTESGIYTQDPDASQLASLNYLATQDPSDSSPSIWTQALRDAGAEAIKGINIPGLVSGFFNSQKANKDPYSFLNSKAAREASDW